MDHKYLNFTSFLRNFLSWMILVIMASSFESKSETIYSNVTDHLALLDFKNRITNDPLQIMNSWNDSLHFCNWVGVKCNPSNERVAVLNLEAQKLVGSIPPSIGNLTYVTGINLQNNGFNGELPQELGRLLHLRHLNLSMNSFTGKIPTNLTHCTDLSVLSLSHNELIDQIPDQLSSLSQLIFLNLGANNLTGIIPPWVGNFSALLFLILARNNLYGTIPYELGRLSRLGYINLYGNELFGTIPPSIFNVSSIYFFSVTQNQLQGQLPPDVGLTLPNLETFAGAVNNFSGQIPLSLPNASRLGLIDFSQNRFIGTVPTNLGTLQGLYRINFDVNQLGNEEVGDLNFLAVLANCTSLEVLGLAQNRFGGELPDSIANLSTSLGRLTMGYNFINGRVPAGIGNLIGLSLLGLEYNYFSDSVPYSVGMLHQLEGLYLNVNRVSGTIPTSLGNLTSLTRLFMEENRLEGSIPSSLGNCQNLVVLNLTGNNLSGTIPKEVISLSSLSISLALAHNSLTGSLPFEVGRLINLEELFVSDNKLSGQIPSSLSSCLSLQSLLMEGNLLQGTIPESLESLRGLEEIDLSRNNLSGQLPKFLGTLSSLKKLSLSFNNFEGEVSKEGIFANASAVSLIGNDKLCGGVLDLHLSSCSQDKSHSSRRLFNPKIVIPVTISVLFVVIFCAFFACYMIRNSRKSASTTSSTMDWQLGISYPQLFTSTNGFSVDNLIGSGSFGSVYRGVLDGDGSVVAVKVFNLQQKGAFKSFLDECKALRSIRHRNLLKIMLVCSSVDHQGNDFKCLVFEFMSNGNLDQWLHPADDERYQFKSLNIVQRLNIAIDVASALDYLHHHCETPIVHCDLKPSNVLLDEDMTGRVGDFGLARFLSQSSDGPSKNRTISAGLKGSIGYIPPEYGMGGQVDTLGDVYSYGILLLEMFTGKRPTEDIFKDGLSIHKYVAMALPAHVMDIVDPSLHLQEEEEEESIDENEVDKIEEKAITSEDHQYGDRSRLKECLATVMRIGLSCSNSLPSDRMQMNMVVNQLHAIRDAFLG